MEIQVQGQDRFLFVQSVLIGKNQDNPKRADILWCYSCGGNVSRIKGQVTQIRAGEIENNDALALSTCPNCHKNFIITVVASQKGAVRLTLVYDPYSLPNVFHCLICRQPLLTYDPEHATEYYTKIVHSLPYAFSCTRKTCFRSYLLEDVVSSTMIP